ncbi:MAG TPA: hypothetical protein PLD46_08550 [Hyphomicrobium sp.]|nr:hypothetical protein [Hyphomicrobium sp.]
MFMTRFFSALAFAALASTVANAHEIPWRDGESRQVGWGSCAKGPCMKRMSWAASKPHKHSRTERGTQRHVTRSVPPARHR